jgi:hypothetical protein
MHGHRLKEAIPMNPLAYYDPNNPYPESDGQPLAENTEQYDWLVKIRENLEILFVDRADVGQHSLFCPLWAR